MKKVRPLVLLGLCLGLISDRAAESQVVAQVGSQSITVEGFQQAMKRLRFFGGDQAPREMLQPFIDRKIMSIEAEKKGLGETPEVMKAVKRTRARRLTEKVYEEEVTKKVVVSEEEMRAYFKEYGLDKKREVRGSHIMVGTLEEAQALSQRLVEGADFAELAREVSADTLTAANGGDMGYWQEEDTRNSPSIRQLFSLSVGEVSEPYRNTRGDYHLIKATEERLVAFDRQKRQIQRILERQKKNEGWSAYLDEQKARFHPVIDEETLHFLLRQGQLAVEEVPPIFPADRDRILLRYKGGAVDLAGYVDMVKNVRLNQRPRSVDSAAVSLFAAHETLKDLLLPMVAQERGWDQTEAVKSYLEEKREQAMVAMLRLIEVEDRILTEKLMRTYYESHQEDFLESERTFFEAGIVGMEEDAQEIAVRVRRGEKLAEIMKGYPMFSDRWRQYDVFHFSSSDTFANKESRGKIIERVRGARAGEVKGPLEITFDGIRVGYLAFHVLDVQPARLLPFDDPSVQHDIRLKLKVEYRNEIEAAFYRYMDDLRRRYNEQVVVYEQVLNSAVSK